MDSADQFIMAIHEDSGQTELLLLPEKSALIHSTWQKVVSHSPWEIILNYVLSFGLFPDLL